MKWQKEKREKEKRKRKRFFKKRDKCIDTNREREETYVFDAEGLAKHEHALLVRPFEEVVELSELRVIAALVEQVPVLIQRHHTARLSQDLEEMSLRQSILFF